MDERHLNERRGTASVESSEEEFSTARSLLKYAGTWVGDDADEPLEPEPNNHTGSVNVAVTEVPPSDETTTEPPDPDFSTARALLKHIGTWVGDDLEEVLAEVYATRSKTRF